MRKVVMCWVISFALLLGTWGPVSDCLANNRPVTEGGALSAMQFPIPADAQARHYLGLSGSGKFRLGQIPGDLMILEVFSVYCPYCQKEAPLVNDLYRTITKRSSLKGKVKLVGIGVGNNANEVHVFKERYKIIFALLPDPNFSLGKVLQDLRTPYFVVLKRNPTGSPTVIYSKAGSFGDPQHFLDSLLNKARLKG